VEPAVKESALESLRRGEPPLDREALEAITVGRQDGIWNFWQARYLEDYIADGGSKIKFFIGKPGSGKTHALLLMMEEARRLGYVTVYLDARQVRLNKFDSIYQAVFEEVDMQAVVAVYCGTVLERLGCQAGQISSGQGMCNGGRAANALRLEIQKNLDTLYHNRKINNNFAMAFTQLCSDYLGLRYLQPEQRDILTGWLKGRSLPAKVLKPLKIFTKIDKYNARNMMVSFLALLRLCGYRGLCLAVDNLNALLERGSLGRALYGKSARNEVYESLRQLVDDFAGFEGAFFVFAGRPELIQDEKTGFKSYEALWMRIQNEVAGLRPNKFADLFNQDNLIKEIFTVETCLELQERLNDFFALDSRLQREDLRCLVDTVSMFSPVRRVIEAIVGEYGAGGDRGGAI